MNPNMLLNLLALMFLNTLPIVLSNWQDNNKEQKYKFFEFIILLLPQSGLLFHHLNILPHINLFLQACSQFQILSQEVP